MVLKVSSNEAPREESLSLVPWGKAGGACAYVSETSVIGMLYHLAPLGPYVIRYGEISSAIQNASNEFPLYPDRVYGGEFTAAILVALAWHADEFCPNGVKGEARNRFGLFQICPVEPDWNVARLLVAKDAARFVANMVRLSFYQLRAKPWEERLSWYLGAIHGIGSANHPQVVFAGVERLMTALKLFERAFPERRGLLPPNRENTP